ncbi:MAG: phage tail protein, partial [Burkholderiales bacterium 12-64-5]
SLTGRDGAAVLLDCSAPIFVAQQADLPEVVAKVVRPLGITRVRIDADETRTLEKVNVEPGETAWSALAHAAEANGLWPWFDPDGTLVVGGPDYTTAPVATLVLWGATNDGNVLNLTYTRSMHRRYSELTVLGQTQGTLTETAKHALKATATDTGVGYYRPRLVVDHEADDALLCQTRARKLIADARLASVDLSATVRGHRIARGGQPGAGRLWQPGQRVNVRSEPHGIDAVFFVMGRRFFGGRDQSPTTQLTLKEDGLWVLDAHPRKRVYRRGKNLSAGGIGDVTVDSSLEAP